MKLELLREPTLSFGNDRRWLDPRLGLMSYGPNGWDETNPATARVIRAGAIGTRNSVAQLHSFLEKLRRRISAGKASENKPWNLDFPGLGLRSRLHFDITLERDKIEVIAVEEENQILSSDNRLTRIEQAVELYERKFADLGASTQPLPQIVFIPISERLIKSCRDPQYEQDKIIYARRTMARDSSLTGVPLLDFHHVLKVLGFPYHLPSQVVRPQTLKLTEGRQDPATMAWNFAVAAYYKATGTPWKLADLDEGTCYVGVSFYVEVGERESQMRAAMAHVYLRTGESQIIRSKPFRWEQDRARSPKLTRGQAAEILSDVVHLYERQWNKLPTRVVVHKSSEFDEPEREGFADAAKGVECLDLVHVYQGTDVRAYHAKGSYPPLRGTLVYEPDLKPAFLYTLGYIPALGTYPGSSVPEPLVFSWDRLDSSLERVADDLMALTKLDWNNTEFCTRQPVTLAVSRKVGDILAETRARKLEPPSLYRFYM